MMLALDRDLGLVWIGETIQFLTGIGRIISAKQLVRPRKCETFLPLLVFLPAGDKREQAGFADSVSTPSYALAIGFFPLSFLSAATLNGLHLGCYLPIKKQDYLKHIFIL